MVVITRSLVHAGNGPTKQGLVKSAFWHFWSEVASTFGNFATFRWIPVGFVVWLWSQGLRSSLAKLELLLEAHGLVNY